LGTERFIDWQDDMAIGIEPFDREHRDLLEAINRLYALTLEPQGPTAFAAAVDRLIHITEEHFTHEETVLRHHGCTNLGMHQREHDELLDDITALRLLDNDPGEVAGMLEMLRDWLLDHIVHFDRGYRGCLEGKEIR
jgi:hemerythrin